MCKDPVTSQYASATDLAIATNGGAKAAIRRKLDFMLPRCYGNGRVETSALADHAQHCSQFPLSLKRWMVKFFPFMTSISKHLRRTSCC